MIFYSPPPRVLRPAAPPAAPAWAPEPDEEEEDARDAVRTPLPRRGRQRLSAAALRLPAPNPKLPPRFSTRQSQAATWQPGQRAFPRAGFAGEAVGTGAGPRRASHARAGRRPAARPNAPKAPVTPLFLHSQELPKRPRWGWDTQGPTRSPGHRITGYKQPRRSALTRLAAARGSRLPQRDPEPRHTSGSRRSNAPGRCLHVRPAAASASPARTLGDGGRRSGTQPWHASSAQPRRALAGQPRTRRGRFEDTASGGTSRAPAAEPRAGGLRREAPAPRRAGRPNPIRAEHGLVTRIHRP